MKENLEKIEHTNTFTLEDEIRKAIKIENEIIKVIKMLETGIPTDETLSVNNEIVTTTSSSTTQNLPVSLYLIIPN